MLILKNKKRLSRLLESLWANPESKFRNFDNIAVYHSLKKMDNSNDVVDETAWNNLNMNDLFEKMDFNISCFGQQSLYHRLKTYAGSYSELETQFNTYNRYINNHELRYDIQKDLINLRRVSSYNLSKLLFAAVPEKPKYSFIYFLLSFCSLLSIALIPFYKIFFFVMLFFGGINIIINWRFSSGIYSYFTELSGLNSLLASAIKLSKNKNALPQIETLKNNLSAAKIVKKSIGWLIIDKTQLNDLAIVFVEYLNQFLLFELITFIRSLNKLKQYNTELRSIFEAVASLDSDIAIAAYLNQCRSFCLPEINNDNIISFESVYHPLLTTPVANDFNIINKSCLITGSNMAGKTTFIKTIGINVILAKTVGFALACKAAVPDVKVYASIKITDDLTTGKSFYFTEVEEILRFIQISERTSGNLFLIDEIYKGTNTAERISASTAVLNYLSKNSITLVTTHDLELEELLKDNFRMFNFSEQVSGEKVFFDYKIKSGKCTGRNAIKLLEISGYPKEIIKDALYEYDVFSKISG